jgi:hypothetical protein
MREQPETPQRRLALEAPGEIVGQRAPLERRPQDELARMQHERFILLGLDECRQVVLAQCGVYMGVARVVEDAEQVVQPNVHAGGLDHAVVEGIETQPAGGDLGADVAIGEQHATKPNGVSRSTFSRSARNASLRDHQPCWSPPM